MPLATRTRGYLPHWERSDAIYFVTFRLADSLPQTLVAQLHRETEILAIAGEAGTTVPADRAREERVRALMRKSEQCLDSGRGQCFLKDPRVAIIVADALRRFHGERYTLLAWCIMPNHVHAIFSPKEDFALETILHSWKSYSAQRANRLLRRSGPFWQREYFDHAIRSANSLARITTYVAENPAKAHLQNWPWVEVYSE